MKLLTFSISRKNDNLSKLMSDFESTTKTTTITTTTTTTTKRKCYVELNQTLIGLLFLENF